MPAQTRKTCSSKMMPESACNPRRGSTMDPACVCTCTHLLRKTGDLFTDETPFISSFLLIRSQKAGSTTCLPTPTLSSRNKGGGCGIKAPAAGEQGGWPPPSTFPGSPPQFWWLRTSARAGPSPSGVASCQRPFLPRRRGLPAGG